MYWTVAAPHINKYNLGEESWLTKFVPGDRHHLHIVPRQKPLQNWHNKKSSVTEFSDWLIYWQHALKAMKDTQGGVITLFPQLPAVLGVQKTMTRKRVPIVAWQFNIGSYYTGLKRKLAQISLNGVDYFVVHTRREVDIYHRWLGIPLNRLEFVPLHEQELNASADENTTDPFITALGSAHRDFPTLFQAVEKLNIPTVVGSSPKALEGLTIPPEVKTPFGINRIDCLRLASEARISVVPLLPKPNAIGAGVITIIEAMHMGRAVIATRCLGAEDYVKHGETGLLVEPESVDDLMEAIKTLWNDEALRNKLAQAGKDYAKKHYSCEAAGAALGRILDKVADKVGSY
jgi:glycosyltransferase involved in cell wall biosynthesis